MYIGIKRECDESGVARMDGQCGLNHYLECNESNCVLLHFFKGTRPPCILDADLQVRFDEEMIDPVSGEKDEGGHNE